jgi:integrin alpha FG-GAP repeat containing protein 1
MFSPEKHTKSVIRIGDINSDSFPDLILAMANTDDKAVRTKVYLNEHIDYPDNYAGPLRRTFSSNSTYTLLPNNTNYASFMDLDENGQLDVLIVTTDAEGNNNISGYYNNYNYDAFFIKSVTLRAKERFVANELGTNYRFISTNLDGSRRMDISYQSAQSSDLTLNLPYAYIGIGRSNNYIENFQVISTTVWPQEENYKKFTPIIPNSQLIISRQPNGNST